MASDPHAEPMNLDRLRALLDAYGASPERWPAAEREPALRLLEESEAARALRHEAAHLDALLDLVPARQATPALTARALARAPRPRRRVQRWRVAAAALPLAAAAAAAVVWLLPRSQPAPVQYAIEDLGVYTTPTDVLLMPPGFDLSGSAPTVGCVSGDLGCPIGAVSPERQSMSPKTRRRFA